MSIVEWIRDCWQNTKTMPWILRFLCQGCMVVAPLMLILLLLPWIEWSMDGQSVGYSERWSSPSGIALALALFLATTGSWGMAARIANSRWLIVASPSVPGLIITLAASARNFRASIETSIWLEAVITSLILYGALFHVNAVRQFFDRGLSK
jgi:hypothetical protein